jgi:hypothetical protein
MATFRGHRLARVTKTASVAGSLPGFLLVSNGRDRPGRHPPNLSMTFLLVTSHSWRGQALNLENVVVAFW